jgi:hypothetical protein
MYVNETNHQIFQVQNYNYDFISNLIISNLDLPFIDLDIFGSYERVPAVWEKVQFSITANQESHSFTIIFSKPLNYLHLKLDFQGQSNKFSKIQIDSTLYKKRSSQDVTDFLRSKKISFLACVRNCKNTIDESLALMSEIGRRFQSYDISIFENDSNDGSGGHLKSLTSKDRLKLFQYDNLDEIFPLRAQRLSFGRNLLLNSLIGSNIDYFVVLDMDGVASKNFDIQSFFSNFEYEECWDAVFPINQNQYYDIWTFRHKSLWNIDYEEKMNAVPTQFSNKKLIEFYLTSIMQLGVNDLKSWLRVESAFGGMGIYKYDRFREFRYSATLNGRHICEHVPFHTHASEFGRQLYINPKFIVYGQEV